MRGDPGRAFDLQGFIDSELKSGKKKIVVPPGRYRVAPKEFKIADIPDSDEASLHVSGGAASVKMHLRLANIEGVEIVAAGVEMICTETTRAITFENCRNVTLSGLSIDYDPLPYTQGRITKLSDDKQIHEVELFPDYPTPDTGTAWKYEIFAPDSKLLRFGSYYDFKVEKTGPNSIRLTKGEHYKTQSKPELAGDIVAIGYLNMTPGNLVHAVCLNKCLDMRLENVTLYASNCFGFFEENSNNTTFLRCRVDRRPPESDPKPRVVPRMRSLNADAFHSKHAVKGPQVIDCVARFNGDDSVAINGDYYLVTACPGGKLRVLAKLAMGIKVNDALEVRTPEGRRAEKPKVLKVEPAGKINEQEIEFLQKQPMDDRMKNRMFGMMSNAYELTLDQPMNLPIGSVVAPADRIGNGFLVQGCDFGYNRSRGAIIKAGQGKIIGNHFTENWMTSILISPEYCWLEAGCGDNVLIQGNTIRQCHDTAVRVGAESPQLPGIHHQITIEDNVFIQCPQPQIAVSSTDGLTIKNNKFQDAGTSQPIKDAIRLENCPEAKLEGNSNSKTGP